MKTTSRRLSSKEWSEIKKLIQRGNKNISDIAKKYNVNRSSIYAKAWREGWLTKKEQPEEPEEIHKETFWDKLKSLFKPR